MMTSVSATLVAAPDLQAILDGRTWLVLPPRKQVRPKLDGEWLEWREDLGQFADDDTRVERRTVPVELPPDMPCPECEGKGWTGTRGNPVTHVKRAQKTCPRCGGSGSVPSPLLVCGEQWRLLDVLDRWERCQFGPVRVQRPTYLPVLDADTADDYLGGDCCVIEDDGSVWLWTATNEDNITRWFSTGARPEPGGVLVVWEDAEVLAEPVVEVRCPDCGGEGEWYRQPPGSNCVHVFHCSTCWKSIDHMGSVPLSPGTGLSTIELP